MPRGAVKDITRIPKIAKIKWVILSPVVSAHTSLKCARINPLHDLV